MFARTAAIIALALPLLAVASPAPTPQSSQCNTGPIQCCNSVQAANSPSITNLFGLLGIVLGPITGQVGLNCSPLNVLGFGNAGTCTAQTVCCSGNTFHGLINIGCTPINLNL